MMFVPFRRDLNYSWTRRADIIGLTFALACRLGWTAEDVQLEDLKWRQVPGRCSPEGSRANVTFADQFFCMLLRMYEEWWTRHTADFEFFALLGVAVASSWLWQDDQERLEDLMMMSSEVGETLVAQLRQKSDDVRATWKGDVQNRSLDLKGSVPSNADDVNPWTFTEDGVKRAVENALGAVVRDVLLTDNELRVTFSDGDYGDGPFLGSVYLSHAAGLSMINDTLQEKHVYLGPVQPFDDNQLEDALTSDSWERYELSGNLLNRPQNVSERKTATMTPQLEPEFSFPVRDYPAARQPSSLPYLGLPSRAFDPAIRPNFGQRDMPLYQSCVSDVAERQGGIPYRERYVNHALPPWGASPVCDEGPVRGPTYNPLFEPSMEYSRMARDLYNYRFSQLAHEFKARGLQQSSHPPSTCLSKTAAPFYDMGYGSATQPRLEETISSIHTPLNKLTRGGGEKGPEYHPIMSEGKAAQHHQQFLSEFNGIISHKQRGGLPYQEGSWNLYEASADPNLSRGLAGEINGVLHEHPTENPAGLYSKDQPPAQPSLKGAERADQYGKINHAVTATAVSSNEVNNGGPSKTTSHQKSHSMAAIMTNPDLNSSAQPTRHGIIGRQMNRSQMNISHSKDLLANSHPISTNAGKASSLLRALQPPSKSADDRHASTNSSGMHHFHGGQSSDRQADALLSLLRKRAEP